MENGREEGILRWEGDVEIVKSCSTQGEEVRGRPRLPFETQGIRRFISIIPKMARKR